MILEVTEDFELSKGSAKDLGSYGGSRVIERFCKGFGMLWANLFLNEVITLTMLLGCLLIITGVGLINFFQKESN